MSDGRAWKRSHQSYTKSATELVRRCVTALTGDIRTETALRDVASALDANHRRIRTLWHHDGDPVVLHHEWETLRYRSGLFFLNLAAHLRAKADEYETAGENLVADQMEFRWGNECKTNRVERRSERCCG